MTESTIPAGCLPTDDLFGAVVEAAPDGIVLVDAEGRISLVNTQMEKLFGYPRTELVGAPIELLLPERVRDAHQAHRRDYVAEPRSRPMGSGLELAGRRKDGTEFFVDVSLSPVATAEGPQVMALVRDVTERREAEERLAYLAALVASSDDAIYSQDRHGAITSWNRGAERLYGYTATEVMGRAAQVLAPEHRLAESLAILDRVLAGERIEHLETERRRKDGMLVPVSLTVSPILDKARRIIGVSVIARDVTEQRTSQASLAESEARLRESEALAHVGGWVWDVASGEVQCSDELYRIHDCDPLDFDGTYEMFVGAVHDDDRPRVRAAMEEALQLRRVFEDEYRVVRPGGEVRWLYARAHPVVDSTGTAVGLRGIGQDVTERHRAEASLRAAYERERAAAEELRAADLLKDEFLSTVSHELRTPLTAIVGFSSLLEQADGEAKATMLATIRRNAEEMRRMIDRLLDFSRLHAGKVDLHPEPRPLADEVARCLDELGSILREHRVDVDVPAGLTVRCDPDAFNRILGNLLSNAAKFAPPGSVIDVRARVDADVAVLSVQDQGPGIPIELQDRVFERFFQTPDQPAGKRGTGVGLAIVQRYAELLGGRVWCTSEPGAGASFHVAFPLAGEAL